MTTGGRSRGKKLIEVALPLPEINDASAYDKVPGIGAHQQLTTRLEPLPDQGVIERIGRGRGVRYLLSRRFYRFLGQPGAYTRRRGLDRETNKALLLRHIQDSGGGATFGELQEVLPGLSRDQVRTLLRELRRAGLVEVRGTTKAARWFPVGPKPNSTQ
jgi:ATP-dependent DNA helicase RecG